jgi:hypothetical protein
MCNTFKQSYQCENLRQTDHAVNLVSHSPPLCNQPTPCQLQTFVQAFWFNHSMTSGCMQWEVVTLTNSPLIQASSIMLSLSCNQAHCSCIYFTLQFLSSLHIVCVQVSSVEWLITHYELGCYFSSHQCYASKTWFVLSVGFWIHKIKSVDNVSPWGVGKITWWNSMVFKPELVLVVPFQC